jgi:hypothetical protein
LGERLRKINLEDIFLSLRFLFKRSGRDTLKILWLLERIGDDPQWSAMIGEWGHIQMKRKGSDVIFSPLTAVYFRLTKKEVDRRTYWVEELTKHFGYSSLEILAITYASLRCDTGQKYDRNLRCQLLKAVRLNEKGESEKRKVAA